MKVTLTKDKFLALCKVEECKQVERELVDSFITALYGLRYNLFRYSYTKNLIL